MQTTEICPFCGAKIPLDKIICPNVDCGAYRVDDDNYDIRLKKR